MTHDDALQAIYSAIEDVNASLPADRQIAQQPDAVLFGKDGKLDSLGLVNLIVGVEGAVQRKFGVTVVLANERAMSQRQSPFRSVDSLAKFVVELTEAPVDA